MFQFSGFAPCIAWYHCWWVAPFGNLRIEGYLHLPEAYRSLSRPSSPLRAKAFPVRPCLFSFASFNYIALRLYIYPNTVVFCDFVSNMSKIVSFKANGFTPFASRSVATPGVEPRLLPLQHLLPFNPYSLNGKPSFLVLNFRLFIASIFVENKGVEPLTYRMQIYRSSQLS